MTKVCRLFTVVCVTTDPRCDISNAYEFLTSQTDLIDVKVTDRESCHQTINNAGTRIDALILPCNQETEALINELMPLLIANNETALVIYLPDYRMENTAPAEDPFYRIVQKWHRASLRMRNRTYQPRPSKAAVSTKNKKWERQLFANLIGHLYTPWLLNVMEQRATREYTPAILREICTTVLRLHQTLDASSRTRFSKFAETLSEDMHS